MKVGITLNDTIRVFDETVKEVYEMFKSSVQKTEDFVISDLSNTSLDIKEAEDFVLNEVETKKERSKLKLSVKDDPFLITHRYEFYNKDEFDEFLYDNFAFEIFARTKTPYLEAMDDLNSLYSELVSNTHNVTIVSQERGVSKQATLLFLAQNKFQGNNIKFLYDYSNIWELYDVIITTNPLIILSKPENKVCIKINTDLNEDYEATKDFDSLLGIRKYFKKLK